MPFSPGKAIAAILAAHNAGLAEAARLRLYPSPAPSDVEAPYGVWELVSHGPEVETFGGTAPGARWLVQVDSYAKSAAEAEAQAHAVQEMFCGSGVWADHYYGEASRVRIGYDASRDLTPQRAAGAEPAFHVRSTDYAFVPGRT